MAINVTTEFASAMQQGLAAQQSGNTELAYSFFERATELDPNSGEAWYGRAGTAGDPDDALVSLGYATALQPNNTELPPQLDFYAQMRASVVGPSDAPTLVLVGQKLAEVGLTSQAEFLFRRAKELDDNMDDASVWLAAVTEDPAEAERLLKKVLANNPDNPLARAGLDAAVTPDLAHKVDGGEPKAEAKPAPAAPPPPAPAPAPIPAPVADDSDLPSWLTAAEPLAPEAEAPAAPTETSEDFASEMLRAMSESPAQAPAEPAAPAEVPEDLAAQPWWNEISETGTEAPAAPAAEPAQEQAAAWWGELEQPTEARAESAEQPAVPEDLATQSWWGAPAATEEPITPEQPIAAEEPVAAEQPIAAEEPVAAEQPAEAPTAEAQEWWQEPIEEEAPAAPAQDAIALAADLLRQGQESLAADDKPAAYSFFAGAIELTPDNEAAWLGRARATDDAAERIECLERVLQINPNNMPAREALTLSRVRKLRDEGRKVPGARDRERVEPRPEEKPEAERKAPEPVVQREEFKPPEPPSAPVEEKRAAPEPAPAAPTQEPLAPAPMWEAAEPAPEKKPEPVPTVSQEEWKLPDKFRTPSGEWNIPSAATAPQVVPVQASEPPAKSGMNVTPYIWFCVTLIILILLTLAALYLLKL